MGDRTDPDVPQVTASIDLSMDAATPADQSDAGEPEPADADEEVKRDV